MINTKAWQHKYIVVSSTNKHTSKICDINGDEIAKTGIWNANLCCAPVNMEKAFVHGYPFYHQLEEIQKKYGRKIKITIFHEEEWVIVESLSSELAVMDVLREFEVETHEAFIQKAEMAGNKARI
jgi:hypothetical protein